MAGAELGPQTREAGRRADTESPRALLLIFMLWVWFLILSVSQCDFSDGNTGEKIEEFLHSVAGN